MARTITITSGKGGVGKTNLSANLSVQLAAQGKRACIFDADLGLANINILFGFYPEKTIEDVILGEATLGQVIIKNYHGIDIIPGSSGVEKIANSEPQQIERLIQSFAALNAYDFLFFDTSAGVSRNVVSFCLASSEIILVITPEPTSLTDAYALLKILCANGLKSTVRIVVNHCKDTAVARQTYGRFKDVTRKYLSVDIQPLGFIVADPKISFAVKRQQPFITLYPDTTASKCIKAIAQNLMQQKQDAFALPTVESFWQQFITRFTGQLNLRGDQEEKKKAGPQQQTLQAPEQPLEQPPQPAADIPAQAASADTAGAPAPADTPAPPVVQPEPAAPDAAVPALHAAQQLAAAESDTLTSRQTAPPAEKTPAPEPVPQAAALPVPPVDQNYYTLLHTLVTSVAAISEEFKQLRKTVEGNGGLDRVITGETPAAGPRQEKPIILDFERYMRQRDRKS
jgi:flagellar biosynthesis protein FlhG